MLRKLKQGERLDPKALAKEFGVTLRAIQRDLNDRFGFLELEKRNGLYGLPPHLLGKINLRDVERFAALAGIKGLFPSLNEDSLRELLTTRMQAAWLVKSAVYEELGNKGQIFEQLKEAILNHNPISCTYQKTEGIKRYNHMLPFKLVNFDGVWYLTGMDARKLKAFSPLQPNTAHGAAVDTSHSHHQPRRVAGHTRKRFASAFGAEVVTQSPHQNIHINHKEHTMLDSLSPLENFKAFAIAYAA